MKKIILILMLVFLLSIVSVSATIVVQDNADTITIDGNTTDVPDDTPLLDRGWEHKFGTDAFRKYDNAGKTDGQSIAMLDAGGTTQAVQYTAHTYTNNTFNFIMQLSGNCGGGCQFIILDGATQWALDKVSGDVNFRCDGTNTNVLATANVNHTINITVQAGVVNVSINGIRACNDTAAASGLTEVDSIQMLSSSTGPSDFWFDDLTITNGTYWQHGEAPVDSTPPVITFVYPEQETGYNNYNGTLNFQTDENSNCTPQNVSWIKDTTESTDTDKFFYNSNYASLGEGIHLINVSCWDVADNNGSTILNFSIDFTAPTLISSLKDNNTIVYNNLTVQNNLTDNIKLYSANASTIYETLNYTDNINSTTYVWNFTAELDNSYPVGLNNITFIYCDAHTSLEIGDSIVNTTDKKIIYDNQYSIEPKEKTHFVYAATTKLKDRYTMDFKRAKSYETTTETFIVKSDSFIDIIGDDMYKGWLVIPGINKWIDFENKENYPVTVKRISDNEIHITTRGTSFKSTGDLNCVNDTYLFYRINTTETYTASETETSNSVFTLFINGTDTPLSAADYRANLYYNNSLYTPVKTTTGKTTTFSVTIQLPLLAGDATSEDREFYWNFTLDGADRYNTSIQTQTVGKMYVGACGGLTNTTTLHFTFYDEIYYTKNMTTNFEGTFFISFGESTLTRNQSFNYTGNYTYNFCIYPNTTTLDVDAVLLYDAPKYPVRNYYFCQKEITAVKQEYNLYHLSTGNATAVIVTLTDDSDDPLVGYFVDLMRWYPGTNQYKIVEIGKTDEDGQVRNQVDLFDVFYKWRFKSCNTIIRETERNEITRTVLTYQIIAGTPSLDRWDSLESIDYNLEWDNTTNTITFSWQDTGGAAEDYCLKVDKIGGLGNIILTDICTSDKSGSIEYVITNFDGRYIASAYTKQSGSGVYQNLLKTIEFFSERSWATYFGATGLIMTGMWLMSLAPIGMAVMGSIAGIPLFILMGLGTFAVAGIIGLQITVFVSLAILVGVMLWRIRG